MGPWAGHTPWHCLFGEKYVPGDWIYNGKGAKNQLGTESGDQSSRETTSGPEARVTTTLKAWQDLTKFS